MPTAVRDVESSGSWIEHWAEKSEGGGGEGGGVGDVTDALPKE